MHEYKITADCESKDLIYLKMSKCAHKFELFYSAFESLCMGANFWVTFFAVYKGGIIYTT